MDIGRLLLLKEALQNWADRKAGKLREVLPVQYSAMRMQAIKNAAGLPLAEFSKTLWGQCNDEKRNEEPALDKSVIHAWLRGDKSRPISIDALWEIVGKAHNLGWITDSQALILHMDLAERKAVTVAAQNYLRRLKNRAECRSNGDAPHQLAAALCMEISARVKLKCSAEIMLLEDPEGLKQAMLQCNPARDADLTLLGAEIDQEKGKLISSRTEATALRSWFTKDGQKWLSQIPTAGDGKMEAWLESALNELGVLPQFCHTETPEMNSHELA